MPASSTGVRPNRSARRPTTGESTYIPAMCTLITTPITEMLAPPWSRWIGVIDMIDTIAVWLTAIPAIARRASSESRTARQPRRSVPGRRAPAGPPSSADPLPAGLPAGRLGGAARRASGRRAAGRAAARRRSTAAAISGT